MRFTCPRCQLSMTVTVWPVNCRCGCRYRRQDDSGSCNDLLPATHGSSAIGECIHRGDTIRTELCPSCKGKVQVKIYQCSQLGECTLAKKVEGVACCRGCPLMATVVHGS